MGATNLVCLLPVRNGARYLPGYFESVARVADAVVALDDGSNDDTHDILSSESLVKVLITNPPRPNYEGWDDAMNRNRLLDAASNLEPRWIMSLDADERLDPSDSDAMTRFIEEGAVHGEGYLLQVYRMIGNTDQYDLAELWVGRLFAWEPGLRFPTRRFHGGALPVSMPEANYRRTTLRIQHLGDLDTRRRSERLAKYLEVDPKREHQRSYLNLLVPPRRVWPWWTRTAHLPVLANSRDPHPPEAKPGTPAISVVVVCVGNGRCDRALGSVIRQRCHETVEIIIVTDNEGTAEIAKAIAPAARVVFTRDETPAPRARNLGLRAASGTYVWFIGTDTELAEGALEACLRIHRSGYAMASGMILNGNHTRAAWATYLLESLTELSDGTSQRELTEPPRRCSYLRSALEEAGGFHDDDGSECEMLINNVLFRRGYGACRADSMRVTRYFEASGPRILALRQFREGRRTGRMIVDGARIHATIGTRWMAHYVCLSVPTRIRTVRSVLQSHRGSRPPFYKLAPLITLGIVASWLGGCYQIILCLPKLTSEYLGFQWQSRALRPVNR